MSNTEGKKESRKRILTLEIEGGGRTFDYSSQKLDLIPENEPIIKLHFLTFGCFLHSDRSNLIKVKADPKPINEENFIVGADGELYTTEEQDVIEELDEVIMLEPNLENFFGSRTGLKKGYLYILDEKKPDEPIEYEIDESGSLTSVSWEEKLDFRLVDGKITNRDYHEAEYNSILWIGYSPIQWSLDFYNRLKNNIQDRKIYMKKIACTGFKECDEMNGEYTSVENSITYFHEKDDLRATNLKSKLNTIQKKELLDKDIQLEKHPGKEFIKPNMFITLEDPINILITIADGVTNKTLEFRALIDSIQTGETMREALQRLKLGNDTLPEAEENYGHLFSLALTSYLMVYSDKDSKKKYDGGVNGEYKDIQDFSQGPKGKKRLISQYHKPGKDLKYFTSGLDRAKVEALIGFKDRQEFRADLQKYRKDLALFLGHKGCKEHLEQYLHNIPERILEGCDKIFKLLMTGYVNPYNWDKHLLLEKDYVEKDFFQDWVFELIKDEVEYSTFNEGESNVKSKAPNFENSDALYALITKPISIIKPIIDDPLKNTLGIMGVVKELLQTYSDKVYNPRTYEGKLYKTIEAKNEFIIKKVNKKFKIKNKILKKKGNQIILNPKLFPDNSVIDWEEVGNNNYTGKKKKIINILKRNDGLIYLGKVKGKHKFAMPTMQLEEKLSRKDLRKNELNKKSKIVLNSRAFTGTVAFLQILNIKGAFSKLSEDYTNRVEIFNSVGVTAELSEAILSLKAAHVRSIGGKVGLGFSKTMAYVGAAGALISAGLCFYQSLKLFKNRDNDAGLAMLGAGIAAGVAIFMSGPLVWVAIGLSVALVFLADWLTDTPLEYFFSNFLLSDRKLYPRNQNETIREYSKRLISAKGELVKDEEDRKTLMLPADAEATLFDALACHSIQYESNGEPRIDRKRKSPNPKMASGSMNKYDITILSFQISISFFQIFNDKDQYDHRIFLFINGLKSERFKDITNLISSENIIDDKNTVTGITIIFNIPQEYEDLINTKTELVYAARLTIDSNKKLFFPYARGGNNNRYMGIKITPKSQGLTFINTSESKKVKNLPLTELRKYKTWQN
ncbi:toxin VasX [Cellulophaga baltica]|uniref:toxin VasX n=1 Tax=Cellulophaga baltica TaxID=76594 RepID=UPI0024953F66|nr:toxin VasX [Cellulophaga baltica]